MKIELVTTGLEVGGAETMVTELALGMKARGHDVGVVSLIEPRAFTDRLLPAGVRLLSLGLARRQKDPVSVLRAGLEFRRHVGQLAPDVVHAHMVHANLFSRVALVGVGAPLICTIHNTFEGGALRDLGYRLTNRASRLNTTISQAATARLVGAGVLPATTRTIYNGVDPAGFAPAQPRPDPTPFRWIAVGRLEKQKDYPTLLHALSLTRDSRLTIAGDGSERGRLEAIARQLGIADRVDFAGVRDDVPNMLRTGDGFVLASAWEGFGLVIVEAMLSALPIVATDSGGPGEIMGRDPACGILVPPGNSAALAEAMSRVARAPLARRREMGQAGSERAAALFGISRFLDEWEATYSEISKPRRGAHPAAPPARTRAPS